MSAITRLLWPALALAMLAGCATAPPAPVTATTWVKPIQVSCQTDAMSEQPCITQARQQCADPAVNTIQLVLAKPATAAVDQYQKEIYDYQATYTCDGQGVASAE